MSNTKIEKLIRQIWWVGHSAHRMSLVPQNQGVERDLEEKCVEDSMKDLHKIMLDITKTKCHDHCADCKLITTEINQLFKVKGRE